MPRVPFFARLPASLRALGLAACAVLAMQPAAAFDLKDTGGAIQRLADLKGKWVVVNFWATWCAPCLKEIPDIAAFARAQGDKVRVLGVALDWDEGGERDANERKVKAFAKKAGLSYPLILGDAASERVFGRLKGLPTTIIYDPAGKEVFRKTGTVTQAMLERVLAGEKVS